MKKAINVRNITKFRRSIRAISPVIATLLMIAIAVVASLVVYAWINGYMSFQTEKAGQAISIPSFAVDGNNMIVYVQNVGQGTVQVGSVYIGGELKIDFTSQSITIAPGDTVRLEVPGGPYSSSQRYDIKVTTTSGTSMTATGKPGTGGSPDTQLTATTLSCTLSSSAIAINDPVTASGTLQAGSSGLSNMEVTITYVVAGQADVVHTQTTDASGGYSDTYNPAVAGSWTVTARFAGDSTYASSSSGPQSLGVSVTATSLTCSVPASATVGTQFAATGSLMAGSTGISGKEITITCSTTGQTDVVNTATTGASGAYSAQITLNAAATWTVTASFAGDSTYAASTSPEQTIIVNNAPTATRFSVTGITSPTTAGTARTVTVTAQDGSGTTITGYRGTVHFTSTDSQATLPTDYTFTASDNGVHTFTNGVTLKTAGTQSVTATDTVTSSITGAQTGITVNAGSAVSLTVTSFPDPVTAGTSGSVIVTAKDAYGNTATGYRGTVHFTSTDSSATLPSNYAFTSSDNGVHTFTGVILKTAGERSITATDTTTSSITGSQTGITVNAASASKLVITGSTSINRNTRTAYTITLRDQYNNPATSSTATSVTLSDGTGNGAFYAGSSGGSAITSTSIPASTSSVTVYWTCSSGGSYTLTAAATGLTSGTLGVTVNW